MKKITVIVLLLAFLAGAATAGKRITVKGSDTMLLLGQRWAEEYMKAHPDVTIQVTGGGSGVGISALINGATDICESSRPMSSSEKDKLKDRFFTTGVEIPVAKDGVTFYLNEANPVAELTLDQIKDLYTGKFTNWKQFGGEDAKIVADRKSVV